MKKQLKYSQKREAILKTFRSTGEHPSAEWVYKRLRPEYPDLSLGTVYRNIALFKQQGELVCIAVVDGQERLDAKTEAHPHFICDACGCIRDLDGIDCEPIFSEQIEANFGHKVSGHKVIFNGLCKECKD